MRKLIIVNKFGPSSNAITGQLAKELADYLFNQGLQIQFVCIAADYLAGNDRIKVELPYAVKNLREIYSGRSPVLRLLAGLVDGFRLRVATSGIKADFVIVMTDPPLLFFWFQLFRRFSRKKLVYWTMDLYPDAFVAGNYIGSSNPIYRLFQFI
ncbi:MAG: hypothetical protein ABI151_10690, partial [Chitinophagaceae bacterium]